MPSSKLSALELLTTPRPEIEAAPAGADARSSRVEKNADATSRMDMQGSPSGRLRARIPCHFTRE
jgi:hypothetical protein